jgi:flagellin-like protein
MLRKVGKKADMGIGTLILFIAMILVAAIAAGVLIQTATNLQSKALETGSRSTRQISTAISTILLYGEVGGDGNIESLFQNIKVVPGSDDVKIADMLISVDVSDISSDLIYNASLQCNNSVPAGKFTSQYLKNGSEHKDGYITVGDVVQLCYPLPRTVNEDEGVRINIVPKIGSVMTVRIVTPPALITKRVFLYP